MYQRAEGVGDKIVSVASDSTAWSTGKYVKMEVEAVHPIKHHSPSAVFIFLFVKITEFPHITPGLFLVHQSTQWT